MPEIVRRHDTPLEDIPGLSPEFMAVLRRGLAKDPAHRFPEAVALRAELSQLTVGSYGGPRHAITSPVTTVAAPRLSTPPPPHFPPTPSSGESLLPFRQDQAPTVPPRKGRRAAMWVGAGVVAVLLFLGAFFAYTYLVADSPRDPDRTAGSSTTATTVDDVDSYGMRTVTENCPAAGVADGQARCVEKAECWSGMVMINGEVNSIRKLACEQGHVYETFAIALVPGDVPDPYADVLEAHPIVQQVCSTENLLASRFGEALSYGAERWQLEVLPPTPDDRSEGLDVYRCVATLTDVEGLTGSVFRPR